MAKLAHQTDSGSHTEPAVGRFSRTEHSVNQFLIAIGLAAVSASAAAQGTVNVICSVQAEW